MKGNLWARLARLEDQKLELARLELLRIKAKRQDGADCLAQTRDQWRQALAPPSDLALLPFAHPWAARLAARIRTLNEQLQQLAAAEEQAARRLREQLACRNSVHRLADRAAEAERVDAERRAQAALDDLAAVRSAYGRQSERLSTRLHA